VGFRFNPVKGGTQGKGRMEGHRDQGVAATKGSCSCSNEPGIAEQGRECQFPTAALESSMGPCQFDHEKLDVYRLELKFLAWVTQFLADLCGASLAPIFHNVALIVG